MNELIKLVPPPFQPVDIGNDQDWLAIERKIGLALPTSYKNYISRYGSGQIGRFLWIYNPFSNDQNINLLTQVDIVLDVLRTVKAKHGESICPYAIFPEESGLLPFGRTDNGDDLFWLTEGNPEEWKIIIQATRSDKFEEHENNLESFLEKLISGNLGSEIITSHLIDQQKLFVSASNS